MSEYNVTGHPGYCWSPGASDTISLRQIEIILTFGHLLV